MSTNAQENWGLWTLLSAPQAESILRSGGLRKEPSNWGRCLNMPWYPVIHPFLGWGSTYLLTNPYIHPFTPTTTTYPSIYPFTHPSSTNPPIHPCIYSPTYQPIYLSRTRTQKAGIPGFQLRCCIPLAG